MSILFIFFLHLLSSSSSLTFKAWKLYGMCGYKTKRLLYYQTSSFFDLGRRTSYDWQATAKKTVCKTFIFVDFCGFCLSIPGVARTCITRPQLYYWTRAFYRVRWVCWQTNVSKQKFDYSFLYLLALEDQFNAMEYAVVHLDNSWISTAP